MEEKLSHSKSSSGTLFSLVDGDIHIDPLQASRSISVTGIPEGTKAADLVIHFQRNKNGGGDVDELVMNKQGSAVITFEKAEVVKSIQEKKQMFNGIVLTVQSYAAVDEEVFELVSAEICLATVEFLTRQQTKSVLEKIADKTGIKWFEGSVTFMISGSLKQVEMSRGYLVQAISQYGGTAQYNEMKRKLSVALNSKDAEALWFREDIEGELERTDAMKRAKNTQEKDPRDEKTDATQTDHMVPVASAFEVDPKFMKVLVKAHETELEDIEAQYHVEIPREAKEGKIILKLKSGSTGEEYEKACDLFIDIYQKMTQVMKMERFSLKSKKKLTDARRKIHVMSQKFPVLLEVCRDQKHWELFGKKDDLEEALQYLQKEEVEIEKESEKEKSAGKVSDDEREKDANPSEFASVTRNKDLLEAVIGRVKVSVYKGDLTSERVDAIVNAANDCLRHDGGLAKAILDKGGKIIAQESNKIMKKRGHLKEGEAVSTKAGNLQCKLVIHAVGPVYQRKGMAQSKPVLYRACLSSFRIAEDAKLASIALPAIGSGANGMPKHECAEVMLDALDEFIRQGDPKKKTISDVRFVNNDEASTLAFRKEFISRYSYNQAGGPGSFKLPPNETQGASQPARSFRGKNRSKKPSGPSPSPGSAVGGNNSENGLSHPLGGSSNPSSTDQSYSGAVKKTVRGDDLESEKEYYFPPGAKNSLVDDKEDECPVCLEALKRPKKLKCKHVFCTDCLQRALDTCNKCPVCQEPQGVLQGNQPHGHMGCRVDPYSSVPGYEGCGTIIIDYRIPSGTQGREHPNPGQRFDGTSRTAYLPDTREGREVLQLLRRAFDARLVFTVGTSNTSGLSNQVTWNDIHHKTSVRGGPFQFGYPDSDYLKRVKEELAAKGIR